MIIGQSHSLEDEDIFNESVKGMSQFKKKTKNKKTHTHVDMLLMACMERDSIIKRETWFLDSGCSNHMFGKKDYFMDYHKSVLCVVSHVHVPDKTQTKLDD